MNAYLVRKLKNFLATWLIYLAASLAIALIATFVILPVLAYIRFGVMDFLPSSSYLIKISKAVALCSFTLSVVMWLWG